MTSQQRLIVYAAGVLVVGLVLGSVLSYVAFGRDKTRGGTKTEGTYTEATEANSMWSERLISRVNSQNIRANLK